MITDFSFGYAHDFSNGLAAVNKNKKWGFIGAAGQLVIPFQFDKVHDFGSEYCIAALNNKWGLIDRTGKWRLENKYESLSGFAFGLAVVSIKKGLLFKERLHCIIDINGNKIVDIPKEWPWAKPVSEKLILIGTTSGYPGERTYGFMNLEGGIITQPQFYTDSDFGFDTGMFKEGMLIVKNREDEYGFINHSGELAIPLQFQSATSFKNGIAKVSLNGEQFYIDKKGSKINYSEPLIESVNEAESPFDEVLDFSEGLAVARKGKLWGVIDENNKIVIDFKFQKRSGRSVNDSGLFFSSHSPKFSCGLIGICEEREDNIYSGYMNAAGEIRIDLKFRIAEPFFKPIN